MTSNTKNPEFKSDSEPILFEGMGTPYLGIYDVRGYPITDPAKGDTPLGMYVSSFEYTYIEGEPDEGQFIIETDNPEIVSLPQLQYRMPIKLQWGYIFPNSDKVGPLCSPLKIMMIMDNSCTFTQNGVKVTIKFSDSTVLLKTMPPTYYGGKDLVTSISNIAKGIGNDMWIATSNEYAIDFEKYYMINLGGTPENYPNL